MYPTHGAVSKARASIVFLTGLALEGNPCPRGQIELNNALSFFFPRVADLFIRFLPRLHGKTG